MAFKHLHIVEKRGVALGQQVGVVVKVYVCNGELGALFGAVHIEAHQGVVLENVGVELLEYRKVAVLLGIERIVEAGHKLDLAASEGRVLGNGAVVGILLEDKQVYIDILLQHTPAARTTRPESTP